MKPALLATFVAAAALFVACGGTVRESASAELELIDGDTLAFPGTLAGTERARRLVLTNGSGGSEFDPLDDIRIGVDGAGLQVEHDCPATLRSKENCTIRVIAAPQVAGTLAGTLTIATSDRSILRSVSGSAVAALSPAAPAFAFQTGSSGAFGPVATDDTLTRTIDIVNRGNAAGAVSVTLIAPEGGWTATNDCAGNVAAGDTCTVTLVFAPSRKELYEAALQFTDLYREGYAPARIELTGTGTEPTSP